MINRVLIRLKVVQIVYSFYKKGDTKLSSAELELAKSLQSAVSLYDTLLFLYLEVWRYACRAVARKRRAHPGNITGKDVLFTENRVLAQLDSNGELNGRVQPETMTWIQDSGILKVLYNMVLESRTLEEYAQEEKYDYVTDRVFCRNLYKEVFEENETIDAELEEQDLFWNGDKELIDSFVIKTIKHCKEELGSGQELEIDYTREEDRAFPGALLAAAVEYHDLAREYIGKNCKRWDADRLAFMDVIIMQVAMAELLSCPEIPVNVTINEYVDIAKALSTPSSGAFVNGMLDTITKQLVEEGRTVMR